MGAGADAVRMVVFMVFSSNVAYLIFSQLNSGKVSGAEIIGFP